MKSWWLLFFVLSPLSAETQTITCYQRQPYLEFQLEWNEGDLSLTLLNPEGVKGLPLYNGQVVADQLDFLKFQAEDLKDWPKEVRLLWKNGLCQHADDDLWRIQCGGKATALTDWPYETFSFFGYQNQLVGLDNRYETRQWSWGVTTQNSTYFLGFRFSADFCTTH